MGNKRTINIEEMKIGSLYSPMHTPYPCVFKYHSIRGRNHMFKLVRGKTNYATSTGDLFPLGGIKWLRHYFKYGK